MSESDNPTNKLDWGAIESETQSLASGTKAFVANLPSGEAVFEYQMVKKSRIQDIAQKHTKVGTKRNKPDYSSTEADRDMINAELVCEGVVDAPDGFPMSPNKLTQSNPIILELIADLADAIEEYSTMDEETRRKFR